MLKVRCNKLSASYGKKIFCKVNFRGLGHTVNATIPNKLLVVY